MKNRAWRFSEQGESYVMLDSRKGHSRTCINVIFQKFQFNHTLQQACSTAKPLDMVTIVSTFSGRIKISGRLCTPPPSCCLTVFRIPDWGDGMFIYCLPPQCRVRRTTFLQFLLALSLDVEQGRTPRGNTNAWMAWHCLPHICSSDPVQWPFWVRVKSTILSQA